MRKLARMATILAVSSFKMVIALVILRMGIAMSTIQLPYGIENLVAIFGMSKS